MALRCPAVGPMSSSDSSDTPEIATPEARGRLGYLWLLEAHGLSPMERGIWGFVGRSSGVQGWKLHVSSIPTEAVDLLSVVIPCLRGFGVPFKVAKEESVLCQLNEGALGGTQIGKFITIYPDSDGQARELAQRLVEMTAPFHGPVIMTDLRLGSVVYARYGNFNPIICRDRLGQVFLCIRGADGGLWVDSYSVPFVCPPDVPNPFEDMRYLPSDTANAVSNGDRGSAGRSEKLLGPGYLLVDVVKQDAKGSVFRAIDLRSQELVSAKVIKQGRQHCLSDPLGRDMRARLQRQERLHSLLSHHPSIPRADPYFEVQGDGYLPIEFIDGESIESLAVSSLRGGSWPTMPLDQQIRLLTYLEQLIVAVGELHASGYVHRDLTASNVWIGRDDRVYLLDLELCHEVGDPSPPFAAGTPGFMSPQQAARKPPAYTDDIYALGCVIVLLLTGMDPRRVLFAEESSRFEKLAGLTGAHSALVEIAARCLRTDPKARPGLDTLLSTVRGCIASLRGHLTRAAPARADEETAGAGGLDPQHLIEAGEKGFLEGSMLDTETGLCLSAAMRNPSHRGASDHAGAYELRRSANRGVAGQVYVLSRLARFGYGADRAREYVARAAEWLLSDVPAPDSHLPGLHFGEAGVAVALAEAIASGLLVRDARTDSFLRTALNSTLDWPDVTHGAAGQGLAALICGELIGDEDLMGFCHRCVDYLVETQQTDGSWKMPPGVDGMSGQTLTGFAHGTSGIVYFLTEYARRFDSDAAVAARDRGARWLMDRAISANDGDTLEWEYSDANPARWRWWCHGGPGIALTFLKLYEHTGLTPYAETATRALYAHPADVRHGNLSQCHGLSGLGEIYLEAGRVLGGTEWPMRVDKIARVLRCLCRESEPGVVSWLVEDPYQPTADLMVGSGGVLHFLLRMSLAGKRISYPLLP